MFVVLKQKISRLFSQFFGPQDSSNEKSINKNAFLVGALLFFSRILGLIREIIISRFVDIKIYDLYSISDKIPSIIRRLSGEGILDYAYIPPLSKFDKTQSKEASRWISGLSGMFVTVIILAVYCCIITSDFWASQLLSQYKSPETLRIFNDLFALELPMVVFYFLSSTFIAILVRYEIFNHSHLGQPIANILKIVTLMIGYSISDSYFTIGLSAVAGATIHIIWQYYGTRKLSREGMKNNAFPDRFADLLVKMIIGIFGFGVACAISQFDKFAELLSYIGIQYVAPTIPIWLSKACYGMLLSSVILLTIAIYFMRKKPNDGTLEYGFTVDQSENFFETMNFEIYLGLIVVTILRKISVFASIDKLLGYVTTGLFVSLIISALFINNNRRVYMLRNSFGSKKKNVYFLPTICLAIAALFIPLLRHVFIIIFILCKLVEMYRNNIISDKLSQKVKEINADFVKNFTNAFFGIGVSQLMSLVNITVAAQIGHGAPSYISRTDRLMQVPINLIAVSFGLALLPRISQLISENKIDEAQKTYNKAIMINVLLSIAGIFVCLWLAHPIGSIFAGGKTSTKDIGVIASLFRVEILSLPALVLSKTLAAVCFATQKSDILLKAAIVQCVVNVPLKIMIVYFNLGVTAFPYASIAGYWANTIFLLLNARGAIDPFGPLGFVRKIKKHKTVPGKDRKTDFGKSKPGKEDEFTKEAVKNETGDEEIE